MFAGFRWGGLLKLHNTSAMEFPYLVPGPYRPAHGACAGPGSPNRTPRTSRAPNSAAHSARCRSSSASTTRPPSSCHRQAQKAGGTRWSVCSSACWARSAHAGWPPNGAAPGPGQLARPAPVRRARRDRPGRRHLARPWAPRPRHARRAGSPLTTATVRDGGPAGAGRGRRDSHGPGTWPPASRRGLGAARHDGRPASFAPPTAAADPARGSRGAPSAAVAGADLPPRDRLGRARSALSAALHLVGAQRPPAAGSGSPGPGRRSAAGTTLQRPAWAPGCSSGSRASPRPALGTGPTSRFVFTHKVSKNIGPWPCWYCEHLLRRRPRLRHRRPQPGARRGGHPGLPATTGCRSSAAPLSEAGRARSRSRWSCPPPAASRRPRTTSRIDNLPPPAARVPQHSWTYPGFGCGAAAPAAVRPVGAVPAAQTCLLPGGARVRGERPARRRGRSEAAQMVVDDSVRPTVDAFGYALDRFTLGWSAGS